MVFRGPPWRGMGAQAGYGQLTGLRDAVIGKYSLLMWALGVPGENNKQKGTVSTSNRTMLLLAPPANLVLAA